MKSIISQIKSGSLSKRLTYSGMALFVVGLVLTTRLHEKDEPTIPLALIVMGVIFMFVALALRIYKEVQDLTKYEADNDPS
ncbi:hypothetical protein LCGC14_0228690 [marine sediment metagenome]|jgi:FtsH-binding integral membrane protein|uniref:Uncharacterized protein n=1 Tax=marine sediment metagenome TaxID=412755 RepID=A0A0F9UBE7_9ZZZZ